MYTYPKQTGYATRPLFKYTQKFTYIILAELVLNQMSHTISNDYSTYSMRMDRVYYYLLNTFFVHLTSYIEYYS